MMTSKELNKLMQTRREEYLKKTHSFNDKKTVLICLIDEKAFLIEFAKNKSIIFDEIYIYISNNTFNHLFGKYGNDVHYFISNGVINDENYDFIKKSSVNFDNIYIGPTQDAYFDLYDKRDNITANLEKISNLYNELTDDKSRNVLVNVLVRLSLPYQFHYYYEAEDFKQYYSDKFDFSENETYVDAGLGDGINIYQFLDKVNWKYKKIYGYEADPDNYRLASYNVNVPNAELFNLALYDCDCELHFLSTKSSTKRGNAKVQEMGDIVVNASYGDKLNDKVTYIKMDIEGSEIRALNGFRNTIIQNKPKLAICIYHSQSDFWEVPLLIKRINPCYKIEIRNHEKMRNLIETVVYAWKD